MQSCKLIKIHILDIVPRHNSGVGSWFGVMTKNLFKSFFFGFILRISVKWEITWNNRKYDMDDDETVCLSKNWWWPLMSFFVLLCHHLLLPANTRSASKQTLHCYLYVVCIEHQHQHQHQHQHCTAIHLSVLYSTLDCSILLTTASYCTSESKAETFSLYQPS